MITYMYKNTEYILEICENTFRLSSLLYEQNGLSIGGVLKDNKIIIDRADIIYFPKPVIEYFNRYLKLIEFK